ncbi:hypothetical protein BH10PAT2_BH10PAT2_1270 [soil metagenome]
MRFKDLLFQQVYQMATNFFPVRKYVGSSSKVGIIMLLCHRDLNMAFYSLKSFFFKQKCTLPIYIVSDGSLTAADRGRLESVFTVTFESGADAISKVKQKFSTYSWINRYLSDDKNSVKRLKLAAILLAPFKKNIVLEPDILYYHFSPEVKQFTHSPQNFYGAMPKQIYELGITENSTELHFRRLLNLHLKVTASDLFNGGVLLLNQKSLNKKLLNKLDEATELIYSLDYARMTYADETLTALMFDSDNSTVLNDKVYINYVSAAQYDRKKFMDSVYVHYMTGTRVRNMYDSIKMIFKTRFFSR